MRVFRRSKAIHARVTQVLAEFCLSDASWSGEKDGAPRGPRPDRSTTVRLAEHGYVEMVVHEVEVPVLRGHQDGVGRDCKTCTR